jgi:heat shock protein HtpX
MISNSLKTIALLALLTGVLVLGGFYAGGQSGALIAFSISLLMNFFSFWFSDRIVLALYGAKEMDKSKYSQIYRATENIARQAGIPTPRLFLLNLPVPNAFATGRNPKRGVVALSSSIIELLDERELKGVIAHEIAHIKNRDILISSLAATIAGAISYIAQMLYYAGFIFGSRDNEEGVNPLGLLAFAILSPIIASVLHMAVSRSREFIADDTAARILRDGEGLARALEKISGFTHAHPLAATPKHEATAHMFISNPFTLSGFSKLFSTHPPVDERVMKLRALHGRV